MSSSNDVYRPLILASSTWSRIYIPQLLLHLLISFGKGWVYSSSDLIISVVHLSSFDSSLHSTRLRCPPAHCRLIRGTGRRQVREWERETKGSESTRERTYHPLLWLRMTVRKYGWLLDLSMRSRWVGYLLFISIFLSFFQLSALCSPHNLQLSQCLGCGFHLMVARRGYRGGIDWGQKEEGNVQERVVSSCKIRPACRILKYDGEGGWLGSVQSSN